MTEMCWELNPQCMALAEGEKKKVPVEPEDTDPKTSPVAPFDAQSASIWAGTQGGVVSENTMTLAKNCGFNVIFSPVVAGMATV